MKAAASVQKRSWNPPLEEFYGTSTSHGESNLFYLSEIPKTWGKLNPVNPVNPIFFASLFFPRGCVLPTSAMVISVWLYGREPWPEAPVVLVTDEKEQLARNSSNLCMETSVTLRNECLKRWEKPGDIWWIFTGEKYRTFMDMNHDFTAKNDGFYWIYWVFSWSAKLFSVLSLTSQSQVFRVTEIPVNSVFQERLKHIGFNYTGWGPPVISGFINHYNPY